MKVNWFITCLMINVHLLGCSANLKQIAVAEGGALGVEKACKQAHLQECAELAEGYKQYILEDEKKATEHIHTAVQANSNMNISDIAKVLNTAASLAGSHGAQIEKFTKFLQSVTEGNDTRSPNASLESNPIIDTKNNMNGCKHDNQCKFDRVCVDGNCVGKGLAENLELEKIRKIQGKAETDINENSLDPSSQREVTQVSLLVPSPPRKLINKTKHNPYGSSTEPYQNTKKCDNGDESSCYAAGVAFEVGDRVIQNYRLAEHAFKKACMRGFMSGCVRLGNIYFQGLVGKRDYKTALSLYDQACKDKDMIGCANAALLFEKGFGTTIDKEKAINYLNLACDLGHGPSCRKHIIKN